ncbi:hypothetical protein KEM52_000302 [Ascosphaera acerosa]|nr:hypothetical protein KEM52_000302 [Ascosphaera acerosa]
MSGLDQETLQALATLTSTPASSAHITPTTLMWNPASATASASSSSESVATVEVPQIVLNDKTLVASPAQISPGLNGHREQRNVLHQQQSGDVVPRICRRAIKASKKPKKTKSWAGILTQKCKRKRVSPTKKQQRRQQQPSQQPSLPAPPSTQSQDEFEGLNCTAQAQPPDSNSQLDAAPPVQTEQSVLTSSEPSLTRSNSFSNDLSDLDVNFDDDHTIVIQSDDYTSQDYRSPTATMLPEPEESALSSFETAWKPPSFYEQGRQLSTSEPFTPMIDLDAALSPLQTADAESSERGSGFSSTAFKAPDVLDEEEEDKFLATAAQQPTAEAGTTDGAHTQVSQTQVSPSEGTGDPIRMKSVESCRIANYRNNLRSFIRIVAIHPWWYPHTGRHTTAADNTLHNAPS